MSKIIIFLSWNECLNHWEILCKCLNIVHFYVFSSLQCELQHNNFIYYLKEITSFFLIDYVLYDVTKNKSNSVVDLESIIVVNDDVDFFYSSPKAATEHVININSGK